jgi:hypothetical protein
MSTGPDVDERELDRLQFLPQGRVAGRMVDGVDRAVTRSGRSTSVVTGAPIIGMAIGALEDPPITVIEGPSVLPKYAPGEKRPKR